MNSNDSFLRPRQTARPNREDLTRNVKERTSGDSFRGMQLNDNRDRQTALKHSSFGIVTLRFDPVKAPSLTPQNCGP